MKTDAVSKSLKVIDLLSEHPEGLSLMDLSGNLGYPKSTLHRILGTLQEFEYVSQNPDTRKYCLGFKFLSIGRVILANIDVRKIAQESLRSLHDKCKEAIHLAILRGGKVVYIDKIDKPGGLSLVTYVGFQTSPHAAAGGKILLSELSEKEIRDLYEGGPLKAFGKNTITNFAQLMEEIENIRKLGYAIDNEEYYEGVRCVAAPIRAGNQIVAAVSITGSIFTMTMERINQELIGMVLDAANEISSRMH